MGKELKKKILDTDFTDPPAIAHRSSDKDIGFTEQYDSIRAPGIAGRLTRQFLLPDTSRQSHLDFVISRKS
ncbi:MAG: hypothetical protein ABIC39_01610 [Pseudomonadota bacterium]